MLVRAAKFLGFPSVEIERADHNNIDCIRTDVPQARGEPQGNISYELAGSSCENVFCKQRMTIYSCDVADRFPHDLLLQELKVCSCVGVPLFSTKNELLGLLVLMSDRPIEMASVFTSVFEFLATRAGMKLTREELKNRLIEKKEKYF